MLCLFLIPMPTMAEGAWGHVSRKMFAADGLHPAAGSACVARAHATTMQRYVARKIFAADGLHLRAGIACAPATWVQRLRCCLLLFWGESVKIV